jgi:DnaK suppressor protein
MIQEEERYTDPLDVAAMDSMHAVNRRLQEMQAKPSDPREPDTDDLGNRYCLDCGVLVPAARVSAVNAVTCVECARIIERRQKGFRSDLSNTLVYKVPIEEED